MIILIFIGAVLILHFLLSLFSFPKIKDNYLVFLLGKKRSGKTTFLARSSIFYYLRGRKVYSTTPLPCARLIDYSDIGYTHFPPGSLVIIDEVGMVWDNRDFKKFDKKVRDYFKLQGHYKNTVIMASQSYDVDKKIRDLADMLGIVEQYFFSTSRIRWIDRKITLTECVGDQPSSVSESLKFRPFLFGGWSLTYRPIYYPFFDSYEAPKLSRKRLSYPDTMKVRFSHGPFKVLRASYDAKNALNKNPERVGDKPNFLQKLNFPSVQHRSTHSQDEST